MIGPSWPMMHPSADLDPVAGASSHKYDGAEVLGQKKVYVPAATHLLRSEALLRAAALLLQKHHRTLNCTQSSQNSGNKLNRQERTGWRLKVRKVHSCTWPLFQYLRHGSRTQRSRSSSVTWRCLRTLQHPDRSVEWISRGAIASRTGSSVQTTELLQFCENSHTSHHTMYINGSP